MANASDNPPEANLEKAGIPHPRARAWLWRPWYAKLWWVAIGLYWTGKIGSYWSGGLNEAYSTALAGYLNIALYPFTALMILGFRFVSVWMQYHDWKWMAPSQDEMFPKRSVGGYRDPMADPLDPRSPKHWRYLDNTK